MKKQTAVEWLLEKWNNYDPNTGKAGFRRIINQAKQMEKEQIMEAYSKGEFNDGCNESEEEYYNQTYK